MLPTNAQANSHTFQTLLRHHHNQKLSHILVNFIFKSMTLKNVCNWLHSNSDLSILVQLCWNRNWWCLCYCCMCKRIKWSVFMLSDKFISYKTSFKIIWCLSMRCSWQWKDSQEEHSKVALCPNWILYLNIKMPGVCVWPSTAFQSHVTDKTLMIIYNK